MSYMLEHLNELHARTPDYVGHNEKIQCLGEDRDQNKDLSSESHDPKSQLPHQVSVADNALQRHVSASAHSTLGLSPAHALSAKYDKICLSLLSGLPNEQELALNVCGVLSNEENYVFDLQRAPKLVNLLVAQTGVWLQDDTSLKMLYLESWNGLEGRNMHHFWRSTLDLQNSRLVQLLGLDLGDYDADGALLNLEADSGAMNAEGQRVLKVALILHDLSFVKSNVPVLVHSTVFIRFLLLSIHSSWSNLKQTAYDTLANLAYAIELRIEKDCCSHVLFQTVIDGLLSPDRFMSIRSMDILSQLCSYGPNEDIIPSRLDVEIYQQMVSFLTVHDIMLLFYTLEALYALSDLGRYACDKIAMVRGSIGTLVSLLTLEPSQYGSSAEIKMKIVEVLVPAESDDCVKIDSKSVVTSSSEPQTIPLTSTPVTSFASKDVTSETFARNWLKSNYESCAGQSVPRNDLYAEYVGYSTKAGRKAVVNANVFATCVKSTFPQSDLKKVQSGSGVITFFHSGLRKKTSQATPILLSASLNSAVPNALKPCQKIAPSPILKAQLSAPNDGGTLPVLKQALSQIPLKTKTVASTQSPSFAQTIAPAQGSSTLIKSLLANKVQQRNIQRQTVPQNVSKMVIFSSPGKVGPSGPTTVMRCVMPQMNIRAPLQARLVGNKGCIITSTPTKVIQPKVFQQQTVIATTSAANHLNGLQSEAQMEVQQIMDSKSSGGVVHTPVIQMNCVPNHVSGDLASTKDLVTLDGNNVQSSKDCNAGIELDQNFILSQIQGNTVTYRLAGRNELPLSSGNRLFVRSKPPPDGLSSPKEQNGSSVFVNSKNAATHLSLMTQPLIQPKINSTSPDILKGETDQPADNLLKQKEEICKKSPLLNGLLDKGKAPPLTGDILFNALVENGIEASDIGLELPETPISVQSPPKVMPSPVNSIVIPASSLSSVIVPASSLVPSVLPLSSSNTVIASSPSSIPASAPMFLANGANVVQIRTGQTTFSGTAEVQPDQKGVVRLHIESPENSNQGSDLSSITDIARTLECASESISRTNAECSTQVPLSSSCTTTVIGTVINTNTATLARPNQQIIVVTPSLNQPQLQLQSPNIKFCILHTVPVADESLDLVGLPQISLNQLQHPILEAPSISGLKRPSSDGASMCVVTNVKKPRVEAQTLHLSNSIPASAVTSLCEASSKPSQMEGFKAAAATKLTTAKAVPIQSMDLPSEKEDKVFSGLSSAAGHPPQTASPPVPPSKSTSKFEYICEWKDCGLKFANPGSVLLHASKIHTPPCDEDMVCLWEGCDSMKRKRFSLLTHLQDWHCNERVLHLQAMRRLQILQQGQSNLAPPPKPPPHPGYAPDAAVLAIKRHALQYINPKELSEEKESALTKSIRLTSALILRNLVTHSSLARTYVRRFEPELAYLAMSPVESAKAIAQCLSYLSGSGD